MSEPVGWLRAVVVDAAVIHARPGESHFRMADPEGNEFTVVLPLPPDVARKAYGPGGEPAPGNTPG